MSAETALFFSIVFGIGKIILGVTFFIFMIKTLKILKEIKEELGKG